MTDSSSSSFDTATLDRLTGGAFSAATSGERTARLREWLQQQPEFEVVQAVAHEMSHRDRGAAKVVRERMEELRRVKEQDTLIQQWAEKGQGLRDAPRINMADAMAWQRDAAKAGAPLSREPLASLKAALAERVKAIEDLQHQAQVERSPADAAELDDTDKITQLLEFHGRLRFSAGRGCVRADGARRARPPRPPRG